MNETLIKDPTESYDVWYWPTENILLLVGNRDYPLQDYCLDNGLVFIGGF